MQAYVGGEVTASGRTKVPLPEVQEEVFDLSALEALAAQGGQSSPGSASKHSAVSRMLTAVADFLHVLSSALPR
jgi:hypothetical protein